MPVQAQATIAIDRKQHVYIRLPQSPDVALPEAEAAAILAIAQPYILALPLQTLLGPAARGLRHRTKQWPECEGARIDPLSDLT